MKTNAQRLSYWNESENEMTVNKIVKNKKINQSKLVIRRRFREKIIIKKLIRIGTIILNGLFRFNRLKKSKSKRFYTRTNLGARLYPPSFRSYLYERKDLIEYILRRLIELNMVAANTSYRDFKAIFSGEKIVNKIVWIGNINCLCYFIRIFFPEQFRYKWEITAQCFEDENGKTFEPRKLRGHHDPYVNNRKSLDKLYEEIETLKKIPKK